MTQANRQDIVITSRRNIDIRNKIVDVFIQAIMEMGLSPILKYTWMRFLPNHERYRYDSFWFELFATLKHKLYTTPCVLSRSQNHLRKIKDLRRLPAFCSDDRGDPLFKDLDPEIWLSEKYSVGDIAILERFGMPTIEVGTLIDMVEQDLRSPNSRTRSIKADQHWHTVAAKMLSNIADKSGACLDRLRKLDLLPIRQPTPYATSWVSSEKVVDAFFPKSNAGVFIPEDVHPWVLEPEASESEARMELFRRLGVSVASVHQIQQMILKRHQAYLHLPPSTVVTPRQLNWLFSQLCYLCHTQVPISAREKPQIALVDSQSRWRNSTSMQPLYIPNNEPFGPRELLRETSPGPQPGSGAPGLQAMFLNSYIFPLNPERSELDPGTWRSWLTRHARVRDELMLTSPTTDELSLECKYVAKHRPEKFLGFLQHRWSAEGPEVYNSDNKLKEMRSLAVLCHDDQLVPFPKTYLPLEDLQEICNSFLEPDQIFPFLKIQDSMRRETYDRLNWSFLVKWARVNVNDDLTFYLDILRHLRQNDAEDLQNPDQIIRLYSRIFAKFVESEHAEMAKAEITLVSGEDASSSPALSCYYLVFLSEDLVLTLLSQ